MKYKELQILKHSLQHYIKRTNITEKELEEEVKLLEKITTRVDNLKETFGIK